MLAKMRQKKESSNTSYTVRRNVNLCATMENSMEFLKTKTRVVIQLAVLLLGTYPNKNSNLKKDMCTQCS